MTAVPVAGATRSNITLSEPDGTVTKINEAGEPLTAAEIEQLADAVTGLAGPGDWVVLSGSVPPGVDADVYAHLTRRFTAAGIEVAVDTSGPALLHAIVAGPALVKPNREELAEALGREVASVADAVDAAQQVRKAGAPHGAGQPRARRRGARGRRRRVVGRGPRRGARSTVGAGDACSPGSSPEAGRDREALATALRWAAAAVERPGSGVPDPADIARRPAYVTDQLDRPDAHGARLTEEGPPGPGGTRRPAHHEEGAHDGNDLHTSGRGDGGQGDDPARRRLPGRDGHAQHRRVHRLGPDHRPVHPDRLAAQREVSRRSSGR